MKVILLVLLIFGLAAANPAYRGSNDILDDLGEFLL
jgi:hypothetical protein